MLKKRLLLLGGGHTHALFIRRLAMMPIPDIEVVLVSPHSLTAYSGMLAGHLAGHYTAEDMHIDLVRLCLAARVIWIQAAALGIDKVKQTVRLEKRPDLSFDVLSINIGSVPDKEEWGLGIKPMQDFLEHWAEIEAAQSIALIGGGAGGVELALHLQARFAGQKTISLIHRDHELLTEASPGLRKKIARLCRERGVQLHLGVKKPAEIAQSHDLVVWTSGARGPHILKEMGLKVDARGFLLTDSKLRCLGEDKIFAVGDCAHIEGQYRPRAGVYAVRLARPLEDNLRRLFSAQALRPVSLQKTQLALIGSGQQSAIAIRGRFYWEASWLRPWKDRIDRRFMKMFSHLQPSPMARSTDDAMRCLGCGAKLSGVVLKNVLQKLAQEFPGVFDDLGHSQSFAMSEDVALVQLTGWTMQSLDYFPAFIDDPFLLGKIACLHAAGDLIAKGGYPQTCLALAVLPHKAPRLVEDDLYQLLAGVASILQSMGTRLIGGHSAEGQQLAVGLQFQGLKPAAAHWKPKSGLQAGDRLVLTKALGTGLVLAGLMHQRTRGLWFESCVQSMLLNHVTIQKLIADPLVHGATDITGFGLLGHLAEMAQSSGVSLEFNEKDLPRLPGVHELLAEGVRSTLALDNFSYAESLAMIRNVSEIGLLCDPQTSGALVLGVAADEAENWVKQARVLGFYDCCIIGRVQAGPPAVTRLE